MHLTPDDIAASLGEDPSIKPEDVLYKYLMGEATIRFEPLQEYFADFGLSLTEQDMIRLMAMQEDILFTEGGTDRDRFWRASIMPNQQAGPASEGYLDHRITDQFDDAMGQDFEGEEEEFMGRDLQGINAPTEPGEMGNPGVDVAGDQGQGFGDPGMGGQNEPPDTTTPATDQSEIPPAAIPQAMPDMVAQAMAAQGPDPNMMEPDLPEPGMIPGPVDQIDINQAGVGPGEEQPAPQTGQQMVQPATVQPQALQPQVVQPQAVPVGQGMVQQQMAQQMPQEPEFGDDGADYTIDPFLNSLKDVTASRDKSDPPPRYSRRMREAWGERQETING